MVDKLYRVSASACYAEEPEIETFDVIEERDGRYIMMHDDVLAIVKTDSVKYAVTDAKSVFKSNSVAAWDVSDSEFFYKKSYAKDYLAAVRKYRKLWELEDELEFTNKCIANCKSMIQKCKAENATTQEELDKKLQAKLA